MRKVYYSRFYPLLLVFISVLTIFFPIWFTGLFFETMSIVSFLIIIIMITILVFIDYAAILYLMCISDKGNIEQFNHKNLNKKNRYYKFDDFVSNNNINGQLKEVYGLKVFYKKKNFMSPFEPYPKSFAIQYIVLNKNDISKAPLFLSKDKSVYTVFLLDGDSLIPVQNKIRDNQNYGLVIFGKKKVTKILYPYLFDLSSNTGCLTGLLTRFYSFDRPIVLRYLTQQIYFEINKVLNS